MTFSQDGRRFRAIAWRAAERAEFLEQNRAGVNLAFSLDRNEYSGRDLPRAQRRRLQGAGIRKAPAFPLPDALAANRPARDRGCS